MLIRGEYLDEFPVDVLGGGGGVAVNMNVNEVIANLANEFLGGARGAYDPIDPKAHVNASQSTADVCHTALRIAIIENWTTLRRVLDDCVAAAAPKRGSFARFSRWREPACRTRSRFHSASCSAATARRCAPGW